MMISGKAETVIIRHALSYIAVVVNWGTSTVTLGGTWITWGTQIRRYDWVKLVKT